MSAIDQMMDRLDWTPVQGAEQERETGLPYATHTGIFMIGDIQLRCYRLNTGQAIINAEDMHHLFGLDGSAA